MTRYSIVEDGARFVVVLEGEEGDRKVRCRYIGHIDGAWALAERETEERKREFWYPREGGHKKRGIALRKKRKEDD